MAEEAVGRDREVEAIAVALPRRGKDVANEDVVLRLRGREGAEVVLADEGSRSLRERNVVDRPWPPEDAPRLERRRSPAARTR